MENKMENAGKTEMYPKIQNNYVRNSFVIRLECSKVVDVDKEEKLKVSV